MLQLIRKNPTVLSEIYMRHNLYLLKTKVMSIFSPFKTQKRQLFVENSRESKYKVNVIRGRSRQVKKLIRTKQNKTSPPHSLSVHELTIPRPIRKENPKTTCKTDPVLSRLLNEHFPTLVKKHFLDCLSTIRGSSFQSPCFCSATRLVGSTEAHPEH